MNAVKHESHVCFLDRNALSRDLYWLGFLVFISDLTITRYSRDIVQVRLEIEHVRLCI